MRGNVIKKHESTQFVNLHGAVRSFRGFPTPHLFGELASVPGGCGDGKIGVVQSGIKTGNLRLRMSLTDGSLAETAGADEERASSMSALSDPREWVARHGDYLYRYALIRVRNVTVAEDMVQEALLAAFESKDRLASQTQERSWLTGILRHKIYDHFRRLSRERTVFESEPLPADLEERFDDVGHWKREPPLGPADWGDAAAMMQRKEFMAALKECLTKLPPRCADAFVLREMEAVESEKIQEILGITASNFWVLLHRARTQLRLCLENNWLKL